MESVCPQLCGKSALIFMIRLLILPVCVRVCVWHAHQCPGCDRTIESLKPETWSGGSEPHMKTQISSRETDHQEVIMEVWIRGLETHSLSCCTVFGLETWSLLDVQWRGGVESKAFWEFWWFRSEHSGWLTTGSVFMINTTQSTFHFKPPLALLDFYWKESTPLSCNTLLFWAVFVAYWWWFLAGGEHCSVLLLCGLFWASSMTLY